MGKYLNKAAIEELKLEHKAEDKARYADRIKAILMLDSGVSASKIAEYLLLNERTIYNYLHIYEEDGLEGLCT